MKMATPSTKQEVSYIFSAELHCSTALSQTSGADLLEPRATRSALEVIEPGSWRTVDGYEFRQYETALSVQSINLESRSTISGYKDFIAVGTIISRGEDLASRGAVSQIMTFSTSISANRSEDLLV